MKKNLLIVLLLCSVFATAQEICTNGIDDDADGLIDLNDTTDCVCNSGTTIPVSLIPNPSFEQLNCYRKDLASYLVPQLGSRQLLPLPIIW